MLNKQHKSHQQLSFSENNQGMNLTPLIDVLFVLILFFMLIVGTNVQNINVVLPKTKIGDSSHAINKIVIEITANNNYVISNKKITFNNAEALNAYLMANTTNQDAITIAADSNSKAERLIQLMAILKQQGYQTAKIIVQKK